MLERLRYVRLPTQDLTSATAFARQVIGLELAESTVQLARFRSDERSYTLEYSNEQSFAQPALGVEVRTPTVLDGVEKQFQSRGLPAVRFDSEACKYRRIHSGLLCSDHSGNQIEIVVRPQNKGRRSFPSRDAGIISFCGVALRCTEIKADTELWCDALSAEVRDYVGSAVYLGFDARHHRVSLHPSNERGFLSIDFEVEDLNCIMQSQYFLFDRQVRIVNGPGREPFSGEIFISFTSPEGDVFTYATAMSDVPAGWRPRQYANDRTSFCNWESPVQIPELRGERD